MASGSTVIIGGGRGFVGQALTDKLKKNGCNIIWLSRIKGGKASSAPNKIVTWDEVKRNGLPQCDGLINLAGRNIFFPYARWSDEFKKELYESRVGTTKLLSTCINSMENPPKVFISTSAIGYYKPSKSAIYDEASGGGDDFFANLCKDWEAAAKVDRDEEMMRQVTIRNGVVLGKDDGVIYYSSIPFMLGLGGPIASGYQWFPWIHITDLVGIYHHAMTNTEVTGVLNGVSPGICNNADFTKAFARHMSYLPIPPILPLPGFLVNLAFGSERAVLLTKGQNVRPKRTLQTGYNFKFMDIDEACKDFVTRK